MPQEEFRKGYLDASTVGAGSLPRIDDQAHSIKPGEDPYRAGMARAVREALGDAGRGGRNK
jgi:hypothetical protein